MQQAILVFQLLAAVFGIICLQLKNMNQGWLVFFIALDFVCSIASGAALMAGIKSGLGKNLLIFFLMIALFVLNAFIVLFIGCTEYGI